MSVNCVFCVQPATAMNALFEPVCSDHTIQHWHDHDGSEHDRYADRYADQDAVELEEKR